MCYLVSNNLGYFVNTIHSSNVEGNTKFIVIIGFNSGSHRLSLLPPSAFQELDGYKHLA
jgi:hypothetical protein